MCIGLFKKKNSVKSAELIILNLIEYLQHTSRD